jgi:hypothetical protein
MPETLDPNNGGSMKKFNLMDYHLQLSSDKVLLYYKGPFEEMILANIGQYIRENFEGYGLASKRLFSILMELAQNISLYSAEKNYFPNSNKSGRGTGALAILDGEDSFTLMTANMVYNEDLEEISKKCEVINSLSVDELKELKRKLRRLPVEGKPNSGNIGLVHVALKSQNPIDIENQKVDDNKSFFVIKTQVNKQI